MAKLKIKSIPKPKDSESEKEFVKRCVVDIGKSNPDIKEDQRQAICYARWEELDNDDIEVKEDMSINNIVDSVNEALGDR